MNKAILMGNITQDLELKQTPNGHNVLSFSVATNENVKKNDTWESEATFHNVVAWGNRAEAISKFFRKGSKILIEGKMKTRNWEADDGSKRYRTEVILSEFHFVESKGGKSKDDFSESDKKHGVDNQNDGISVEDIPF